MIIFTTKDVTLDFQVMNTYIHSASEMISLIREIGMIPFTRCTVPGWSVQEMTDPDFWFTTSDQLGPWDWKIDAVQEGIVYGKFLSRKSAFATEEMYRHLMNWRRSLPRYRMAEGDNFRAGTIEERLWKYLSPTLLKAIREHETLDSSELRSILEHDVPMDVRKKVGGHVTRYLIPKVTKQAVDFIMQYLDMGTWTIVGDIQRVYRGPNCEYKGWQRNSITTPDALFRVMDSPSEAPFWAKFVDGESLGSSGGLGSGADLSEKCGGDCTPEESLDFIVSRIRSFFPDASQNLEKLIIG